MISPQQTESTEHGRPRRSRVGAKPGSRCRRCSGLSRCSCGYVSTSYCSTADSTAAAPAPATSWRKCDAVTRLLLLELLLVHCFLAAAPPCGRSPALVHVVHQTAALYARSTAATSSSRAIAAGLMT